MASPQRPLPNEPRRDPPPELENLQTGRAQREVSSGWRFGFWWIWILIIAGIWYVGFGWGTSGGWIWGHRHAVQTTNDTALRGPGVAIVDASNKLPYIGQAFEIQNVPVQRVAGPQAYWIGSTFNSVPMLVVNASNAAAATAKTAPTAPAKTAKGSSGAAQTANQTSGKTGTAANGAVQPRQWLDVTGRVVKAPPAAQAEQQWGLSAGDANRLESEGAYIDATAMQTVGR